MPARIRTRKRGRAKGQKYPVRLLDRRGPSPLIEGITEGLEPDTFTELYFGKKRREHEKKERKRRKERHKKHLEQDKKDPYHFEFVRSDDEFGQLL